MEGRWVVRDGKRELEAWNHDDPEGARIYLSEANVEFLAKVAREDNELERRARLAVADQAQDVNR